MRATVVRVRHRTDLVEVTQGPVVSITEDGKVWSEPGDMHRRYVPGVVNTEVTIAPHTNEFTLSVSDEVEIRMV